MLDEERLMAAPLREHEAHLASLPESLQLPRAQWTAHPAFATQTLLLRGHESFRARSTHILEALERMARPDRRELQQLHGLFRGWMGAMSNHEGYEEGKLYPYLCRKYGMSLEHLQRDHLLLHECEDQVHEALATAAVWKRGGRDARGPADVMQEARDAYGAYHRVLFRHLKAEEECVIPALLELTPQEFRTYYDNRIHTLMAMMDRQGSGSGGSGGS